MLTLAQLIRHCIVPMYHWTNKLLWLANISIILSHCCLLTPLCDIKNLGQHWFMWWHVAWQHHGFTLMSVGVPFPFLAYTLQGNIYLKTWYYNLQAVIEIYPFEITALPSRVQWVKPLIYHLYVATSNLFLNKYDYHIYYIVFCQYVFFLFFCFILLLYASRISFQLPLMCYVAYSKPV